MKAMSKRKWNSWLLLSEAYVRQVRRAVDGSADADEHAADCALAIVAMAFMLEAYANLHTEVVFSAAIVKRMTKLPVYRRYKLRPRLGGACLDHCEAWESDPIHEKIRGIFIKRNKIAHGNLSELSPAEYAPSQVRTLWNTCLDLLVKLETGPGSRIPPSRYSDFEQDVDSMRV